MYDSNWNRIVKVTIVTILIKYINMKDKKYIYKKLTH